MCLVNKNSTKESEDYILDNKAGDKYIEVIEDQGKKVSEIGIGKPEKFTRFRAAKDGWNNTVEGSGKPLSYSILPGGIQTKMMYQGTLFELRDKMTISAIRKLIDEDTPLEDFECVRNIKSHLNRTGKELTKEDLKDCFELLSADDFETLVDLVFQETIAKGYKRFGRFGGNQYGIDLGYIQPDETDPLGKKSRYLYVQVKGHLAGNEKKAIDGLEHYVSDHENDPCFIVYHDKNYKKNRPSSKLKNLEMIGADGLAELILKCDNKAILI